MKTGFSKRKRIAPRTFALVAAVLAAVGATHWTTLSAQTLNPGDLLLSRTVYDGSTATVAAGQCSGTPVLPIGQSQALPGAVATTFSAAGTTTTGAVSSASGYSVAAGPVQVSIKTGGTTYTRCLTAISGKTLTWSPALPSAVAKNDTIVPLASADGSFPGVWANESPDPSFGITSPIFLDQMPADNSGSVLNSVAVDSTKIVTSFPSKSELGLNLSPDGWALTFMGYNASENQLDVSNSNTPGHVDATNPVASTSQREVAQLDPSGSFLFTPVNVYSGNNGRAAIRANADDGARYYMVGNAGNGGSPEPLAVINNTGVQTTTPSGSADATVVGQPRGTGCTTDPVSANGCQFGFSIADVGGTADKSGKDDNFRGITVFGNTLYATKGSGSNGIDTVYQVGSKGTLPTGATAATTAITIPTGLPTAIAKTAGANNIYPFGMWFADENTLYLADEGDGNAADSATSPYAGLQKWIFDGSRWNLAYVLQSDLNLGTPYPVAGYPLALDPAPAGLRNLTGRRNDDGTATIWAITSTTSANTDQGADPNQLVMITDNIGNTDTTVAKNEQFTVLRTAQFEEAFRGVSFTPGTINPVWTVSALPAPNGAGWNNSPVTVSLNAALADGSVQSLQYTLTGAQAQAQTAGSNPASIVVNTDGSTTVSYFAQNAAGSRNATRSLSLQVDQTLPTISAAATTSPNAAGWYNGNVVVHFTCSDSGSGIPAGACPADQTLSTEGSADSSIAQNVTDAAGNTSAISNVVTVKIDKTLPTISAAATTSPNAAGWYNGNVVVHFTCSDSGSGIPASTCPADQTLSTEGSAVSSIAQTVTDAAGNTSNLSNVLTVKIDKTLPTFNPVVSPNPVVLNGIAVVTSGAADGLSGLASQSCGPVVTASLGTHSVMCTAADIAGNVNSANVSYVVLPLLALGSDCNGTYIGTFKGNVTVKKGQTCILIDGGVTGNISQSGGSLSIANSKIGGNVEVEGGSVFSIVSSTTIGGNLEVQNIPAGTAQSQLCATSVKGNLELQNNGAALLIGSSSQTCTGNAIGGNLSVENNKAQTVLNGNTVKGNLQDENNKAPTQVFSNIVGKNLQCEDNSSITGGGNTAKSKQGQCSSF